MSAALVVLPALWAVAENAAEAVPAPTRVMLSASPLARKPPQSVKPQAVTLQPVAVSPDIAQPVAAQSAPSVAFYRKYTEALLRRYVRLSMSAGRAPSLLGREMFRGKVTNYRVEGFDDMVIFVHDVERCVSTLEPDERILIERIAMQEHTFEETAGLTGWPLRSVERWYTQALDRLTEAFLTRRILVPKYACQEG